MLRRDQETEETGVKSRLRCRSNFTVKCRRKSSIKKHTKDGRKLSIVCTEKSKGNKEQILQW